MATLPYDNLTHHCEIDDCDSGFHDKFNSCKNKDTHKHFISVDDFPNHIPSMELRTEEHVKVISNHIGRTGRVCANVVSKYRPKYFPHSKTEYPFHGKVECLRSGTGYLEEFLWTGTEGTKEISKFRMSTSIHVIFDTAEAKTMIFELDYDSEDRRDTVRCLKGLKVLDDDADKRVRTDRCDVVCFTDDSDLATQLKGLVSERPKKCLSGFVDSHVCFGMLISHPHGTSKKISFGSFRATNVFQEGNCSVTIKKGTHFMTDREVNANTDDPSSISEINGTLPHDIIAELPKKCMYHMEHVWGQNTWRAVKFPDGTKFTSSDGQIINQPKERLYQIVEWKNVVFFYDMKCCPGCSGSRVFRLVPTLEYDPMIWYAPIHHFGVCNDNTKGSSGMVKFES